MHKKVAPDVLSIALAEPSRRALLENLRFGQKSVTELVHATQLKQPNVSNHLSKMREQGIVRAERIGRQVYYSLSMPFADVLLRMHDFAAYPAASRIAGAPSAEEAQSHAPTPTDLLAANQQKRQQNDQEHGAQGTERRQTRHFQGAPTSLSEWQNTYFQSILGGKEDQATHLVNGMLSQGLDMETIYIEVFQWAINRIGEMFQQGATDEAHEHMASAITERMMARVAQFHTPVTRLHHRALLGCVAGNWHVLGLRMLADGLRGQGWDTIFLGANVPTASFTSMVQLMRPDLVVISCAIEDQAEDLLELVAHLRALREKAPSDAPHTAPGDAHSQEAHSFLIAVGGHYVQSHGGIIPNLHVDLFAPDLPHFLGQVRTHFAPQ